MVTIFRASGSIMCLQHGAYGRIVKGITRSLQGAISGPSKTKC